MPDPITWDDLVKAIGDLTTIDEEIDAKILTHNLDASAHGQSDESVYNHRISSLLDHVNYSIYNIKLHPETRTVKAFVDIGGAAEFTTIQDAIDYTYALGGGRVFNKPGIYYPKNDVIVPSNIWIEGEDRDSVIFDFEDQQFGFIANGDAVTHKHNIKIDNIQITHSGNWENGSISLSYVDDADVINCKFIDNYYDPETAWSPVVVSNCTEINVKNNYFNESQGVVVSSGGSKITIEDNYFYNFNQGAFNVNGASQVNFRNNYLDGTDDDAINIQWSGVIVEGNTFVNCRGVCINVYNDDNIIIDNIMYGNASAPLGVWMSTNVDNCIVSLNKMIGQFSTGIYLASGVGNSFVGNVCKQATIGLDLPAGANYNSAVGNVFRGCGTPIHDLGTGNVWVGLNVV